MSNCNKWFCIFMFWFSFFSTLFVSYMLWNGHHNAYKAFFVIIPSLLIFTFFMQRLSRESRELMERLECRAISSTQENEKRGIEARLREEEIEFDYLNRLMQKLRYLDDPVVQSILCGIIAKQGVHPEHVVFPSGSCRIHGGEGRFGNITNELYGMMGYEREELKGKTEITYGTC